MMSLIVAVGRNSDAPMGAGLTPVAAAGPSDFGAEHAAARSNVPPAAHSHPNTLEFMRYPNGHSYMAKGQDDQPINPALRQSCHPATV